MTEIGISLLAFTINNGVLLFSTLLLPFALAVGVWGLALSAIYSTNKSSGAEALRFHTVQGMGRQMPIASFSVVLACF